MSTVEAPAPPKKAPPPPPKAAPPKASNGPPAAPEGGKEFQVSTGLKTEPLRVCIYGTGGIGKSELAANISQTGLKVLFIDADRGSSHLDVHRVEGLDNFADLRSLLHSDLPHQFDAIVFDTLTKIEEWATAWTIGNVKHEKGHYVSDLNGYGFGKGLEHVFDTFLNLIGDFDLLSRKGKHVITIAHDCTADVPNPGGENWIRYEPRLQSPKSGKSSIRHRIKEWSEHLFYVGYDVMAKDGKATGAGTRAIYTNEMPTHWAKSRTISHVGQLPYSQGSFDLWNLLLERNE